VCEGGGDGGRRGPAGIPECSDIATDVLRPLNTTEERRASDASAEVAACEIIKAGWWSFECGRSGLV
jgi:hypothetical protein